MCHLMSHGCRQIHSQSARCCPARLPSMRQRATTLRPTLKAGPQAGIWAEVAALFHWPIYWLRSVSSDISGYNALSGYNPDTSQQHTRRLSAHRPRVSLDGSAGLTAPYHLLLHVISELNSHMAKWPHYLCLKWMNRNIWLVSGGTCILPLVYLAFQLAKLPLNVCMIWNLRVHISHLSTSLYVLYLYAFKTGHDSYDQS